MKRIPSPPRWAEKFLEWYCRPELLEDLQGDLNEYYQRNIVAKGDLRASLIYIMDVVKFFRPYTIKRIRKHPPMNNFVIIQNSFKTSVRSLAKNKLFSAINVIGLAISMSIGLLLIAFVLELKSFDRFHKNYDRLYAVTGTLRYAGGPPKGYMSIPLSAGKRISEEVSGIESTVVMRRGLSADVQNEDKIIPLRGMWASGTFFDVFSFKVISGNPAVALTLPYSLVLTRSGAEKLFGPGADPTGSLVRIDSSAYKVTALVEDPPMKSHLRFDMIVSLSTLEQSAGFDKLMAWNDMWMNHAYVVLSPNADKSAIQQSLDKISEQGNNTVAVEKMQLHLLPIDRVIVGEDLNNTIGPTVSRAVIWTIGILALIVIVSACFNYTNLSIARALRRAKEVSIRKVSGASSWQIFSQFVLESVVISFLSMIAAIAIFMIVRKQFIEMDAGFGDMVTLTPTLETYVYFVLFAVIVGIVAGIFPAIFFSKLQSAKILKNLSNIKLFGNLSIRKGLIIFQYTLSIAFIVAVGISYKQYKYSITFDLGFKTENIFVLETKDHSPEVIQSAFSGLPEIKGFAASSYLHGEGTSMEAAVKYADPADSAKVIFNYIDENFIGFYGHKLLAGENFHSMTGGSAEPGLIVNEHMVKWMGLPSPELAIGEELEIKGKKLPVIGVIRDFQYNRINYPIENFAFRYDPSMLSVVSLRLETDDVPQTMKKAEATWRSFDKVHKFDAEFYDEKIEDAYNKLSWTMKIMASVGILAISVATLGLFGMVIFTTETRLKEISIRKVLGATETALVVMMSRGFLLLLTISCVIAIPSAYYFFDAIMFAKLANRAPLGFVELFGGSLVVIAMALLTIASQTLRVARANPTENLRNE